MAVTTSRILIFLVDQLLDRTFAVTDDMSRNRSATRSDDYSPPNAKVLTDKLFFDNDIA